MLEVSNLSRCYGSFTAVDDVSFRVGHGEIVGLLGHNGAGKTTIMKIISGCLEPDQGSIRVDGVDVSLDAKIIQQKLGYLPESLPLYPEMLVADYLDYAAELKGLHDDVKFSEIKRVIATTEIGEKLLAPIATLSRGFKQRLGVAQAILGKPKLLILDEPTNGLDPTQIEHMRQLIRDLTKHATVILSTHIMQEVDALCDRVLILHNGRLAVDAGLESLRTSNHLLLDTNMPETQLQQQLQPLVPLAAIEKLPMAGVAEDPALNVNHYRLQLQDAVNIDSISAAVANAVINAGFDLYCLQRERRDLETLFRAVDESAGTVNSEEELNHAA